MKNRQFLEVLSSAKCTPFEILIGTKLMIIKKGIHKTKVKIFGLETSIPSKYLGDN